jgi:hypothetical protein
MAKKIFNLRTLIILIVITAVFLLFREQTARTQWLDGWSYRESIIVKERSGQLLEDYQVKVVLDSRYFNFNLCKEYGSDIRFTDEKGNQLSYWIESWPEDQNSDGQALIWVKIPEIKPFEKKEIFMYYGNETASSYSNLSSTMDFIEIVKTGISSSPTVVPFNLDHDLAIASPPEGTSSETCSVFIFKDGDSFKAVKTNSSYSADDDESATSYFLGSKQGTFILGGTVVSFSSENVDACSSYYFTSKPSNIFFEGSKRVFAVFPSINDFPPQDVQMQLLYPKSTMNLPYGSSITLQTENDNTTETISSINTSFLRLETNVSSWRVFDATLNDYTSFFIVSTQTASTNIGLPQDGIFFLSLTSGEKLSRFPYIRNDRERILELRKDESLPLENGETTREINLLVAPKTGVFPVAKYVRPEPAVTPRRISGYIFEDKNLSFSFESTADGLLKNVSVRLYEDVNKNGQIDLTDIFIAETRTDENGEFAFPAKLGRRYIVAASAFSAGKTAIVAGKEIPLVPEQTCSADFVDGKSIFRKKPGGESPNVSDMWSNDPDPAFNVYEHTALVDLSDSMEATGVAIGFSKTLVVSTIDSSHLPLQGSLRQALLNASKSPQSVIGFYLSDDDPGYSPTIDEFVISVNSALPTITAPLNIDGKNLNRAKESASIIISGSSKNVDVGFFINSPNVTIKNIKISGFEKAIYIDVPQIQIPVNKGTTDNAYYITLETTSDVELLPYDAESGISLPFIKKKTLGQKYYYSLITKDLNEPVLLKKIKGGLPNQAEQHSDALYEGIALGKRSIIISADSAEKIQLEGKTFVLENDYVKILKYLNGSPFITQGNPTKFPGPDGILISRKYIGFDFVIPLKKGSTIFLGSEKETTASITDVSGYNLKNEYEIRVPASLYADDDKTLHIRSSKPLAASLSHNSLNTPIPPASTEQAGIVQSDLIFSTSETNDITFFASREDGEKSEFEFVAEPGKIYTIKDIGEFHSWLEGKKAAVVAISRRPLNIFGEITSDYNKSIVPFLPLELLPQKIFSSLNIKEAIIVGFSPSEAMISTDSLAETLELKGTVLEPDLKILESNTQNIDISSDEPILVLVREKLTGQYVFPESLDDNVSHLDSLSINSSNDYPFNSKIRIENCSFLACSTGVDLNEGIGVSLLNNRYLNCSEKIDVGSNGRDIPDDKISIYEQNLGVDPPVLTSAVFNEGTLTVTGYIGTTESATFDSGTVEIHLSDKNGDPLFKLGEATVSNGYFEFTEKLEGFKPTAGDFVVAVFTFKDGSTSEFSDPLRVDPAPVIFDVGATHITPLSETTLGLNVTTITWYTDVPSTSKVVYDIVSHASTETYAYETTETTELVTTHTVVIYNLLPNKIYYFRVISKNEYGDTAISYEYMIPPGRADADTDLCAACHRAHTSMFRPLRLPYYVRP